MAFTCGDHGGIGVRSRVNHAGRMGTAQRVLQASAFFFCLVLVSQPVVADHNRFDYRVDLGSLDWFDRGLYKASLPFLGCMDKNEFYAYADSNAYDGLNRGDITSYKYLLGFDDLVSLSGENPSDGMTPDDFSQIEDLHCSTFPEYQRWRAGKPSFSDDDYFHLFGYADRSDFEERDSHYAVNDYWYPADAGGFSHQYADGGMASWVPFSWYEMP